MTLARTRPARRPAARAPRLCRSVPASAAFVALALAASAPPAGADTVSACLDPGGDLDAVVLGLAAEGWRPVDATAPLPEDVAERLIWPFAMVYLDGDTGGADLPTIVTLQRRAVAGLARKRDLPGSRTRILTRGDGTALEAVLATRVQISPHLAEIRCRFAFADPAAAAAPGTPGGLSATAPVRVDDARGGFSSVAAIALDADALAARLGAPVPVTAIVETTLRFPNEVPQ